MSAADGQEPALEYARDELPMPATKQGVLDLMRRVLSKPYVEEVVLRADSPVRVAWHKAPEDSLFFGDVEDEPDVVLARIVLIELGSESSDLRVLCEGLLALSARGLFPSHIWYGSENSLKTLLGIPWSMPLPALSDEAGRTEYNVLGTRGRLVPELPPDVIILLGAAVQGATLAEVSTGVRIVI